MNEAGQMARQSTAFKIGWVLMFVASLAAIGLGIVIAIPTLDPGAEPFMQASLQNVRMQNPKVADWVWHENKESIIGFILLGVASASMTWNAVRRGERWAWATVLLIAVGYGILYMVIHISIAYLTYIPAAITLTVLIIIGGAMTAKTVFRREQEKQLPKPS
jgi:flagellar biosynthesis protein FliQ